MKQNYRIRIEPLSSGTNEYDSIRYGDGKWVMTPAGPVCFVIDATDAQITGIIGYIVAIKGAQTTTTIETAVAAVAA
jgi:hypothetical protein